MLDLQVLVFYFKGLLIFIFAPPVNGNLILRIDFDFFHYLFIHNLRIVGDSFVTKMIFFFFLIKLYLT